MKENDTEPLLQRRGCLGLLLSFNQVFLAFCIFFVAGGAVFTGAVYVSTIYLIPLDFAAILVAYLNFRGSSSPELRRLWLNILLGIILASFTVLGLLAQIYGARYYD